MEYESRQRHVQLDLNMEVATHKSGTMSNTYCARFQGVGFSTLCLRQEIREPLELQMAYLLRVEQIIVECFFIPMDRLRLVSCRK